MNDPVVVNEAKTCKLDKANQGAVSLNYCRPEDPGLRDLPVREPEVTEPEVTDPGCGAVLADQMSAGAGGYLPEGWVWTVGVDFTYAIIDDVTGVVDDVGDVINVIGRRDGSGVIVLATGEDFARIVIDHEVVVIVIERSRNMS